MTGCGKEGKNALMKKVVRPGSSKKFNPDPINISYIISSINSYRIIGKNGEMV